MEAGRYQNGYEYVKMGKNTSKRKILVIPGLNNEMIRTTRYPLYLRYHYRGLKNRQIIVASRKEGLSQDITTEEMAQHYKEIIDEEGPCNILSVSMGGFIAQHLATKTDKIEKLVLGFTGQKLGESGRTKIKHLNFTEKSQETPFQASKNLCTNYPALPYGKPFPGLQRKI
jgi:pimeloyl-ACP methyl ester carboxylesterase